MEFILIDFSLIVKQEYFAYVNQAWICSRNQSVLSNEGEASFDRARTLDWQASTDYKSDALTTAPYVLSLKNKNAYL